MIIIMLNPLVFPVVALLKLIIYPTLLHVACTCRQKTEALLRYHLYVDCMPPEGMEELNKESVERMLSVARSSVRLKEPQYVEDSYALLVYLFRCVDSYLCMFHHPGLMVAPVLCPRRSNWSSLAL